MQIEQAYVKFDNREKLIDCVKSILADKQVIPDIESTLEMPNCFDNNNAKRKIGVSPLKGDWISILDSSEFNDYSLLITLSKELEATVVAVSYSDIESGWGYAEFNSGAVSKSFYVYNDDDNEDELDFQDFDLYNSVLKKLGDYNIDIPVSPFREIANTKQSGWTLLKK